MRDKNKGAMTPEQHAAQTAIAAIAIRQARGERVSQSAISEAVRRAAEADMDAQFTKSWGSEGSGLDG
jgi:hypothetical protein